MKIYVASSWRNDVQPGVVERLRLAGHEVYDFRNPPGRTGFAWSQLNMGDWRAWTAEENISALNHPIAEAGFKSDYDAMQLADAGVLVMPCGRSAHLEAGFFVGAEKPLIILTTASEPELMYKMADAICLTIEDVLAKLEQFQCEGCMARATRSDCEGVPLCADCYQAAEEDESTISCDQMPVMTGIERIAAERQRQISVEGWTQEHDDTHTEGEMPSAAACYALLTGIQVDECESFVPSVGTKPPGLWPSSWVAWWKPSIDPIRNLEKAGALIAAEIDRILRQFSEGKPIRKKEGV